MTEKTKGVVTVFVDELRIEFSGPIPMYRKVTFPDTFPYDEALAGAKVIIKNFGGSIINTYSEVNEFGDPITCFFIEMPD